VRELAARIAEGADSPGGGATEPAHGAPAG
jgi:hypothetical protein